MKIIWFSTYGLCMKKLRAREVNEATTTIYYVSWISKINTTFEMSF